MLETFIVGVVGAFLGYRWAKLRQDGKKSKKKAQTKRIELEIVANQVNKKKEK